jgi:CRP-like cAMP-binding protein
MPAPANVPSSDVEAGLGAMFELLAGPPQRVATRGWILQPGGSRTAAAWLLEGSARLVLRGAGRRRLLVRLVGPGEVVGLAGALLGSPWGAALQARVRSRVRLIPAARLRDAIAVAPPPVVHALGVAALLELGRLERAVARLAEQPVERRLLAALAECDAAGGLETATGGVVSQRELAMMVGLAPTYLCGLLKRLERDGLVVRDGQGRVRAATGWSRPRAQPRRRSTEPCRPTSPP